MTTLANAFATRPMVLRLSTAAELMTRNPLSLDKSLPISAAIALLDSNGLAEAPMVDELNRPEGESEEYTFVYPLEADLSGRVYVMNDADELIGVASTTDVLRQLFVGTACQRV